MEEIQVLLDLNERLLQIIFPTGNFREYSEIADPKMTCFEPECNGNLVEGLQFHKFYFPDSPIDLAEVQTNTTIVNPSARILQGGQSAVVAYTRMVQKPGGITTCTNETRIFEMQEGKWVMVHMHRSNA
jgi:hypothetical protein